MHYRTFASMLPATLTAILLAAPSTAQAEEWHKTYTVSGKSVVRIETNDGEVLVSTREGKQIEARVETIGWRIDDSDVRIIERLLKENVAPRLAGKIIGSRVSKNPG